MEFPLLGRNCSKKDCEQLDFLPLQCHCLNFFCKEHFTEHCLSKECEAAPQFPDNFTPDSVVYTCESIACKRSSYLRLPCPKCDLHYCIDHRFHPSCPDIDLDELECERLRWTAPRKQYEAAKENVDALVAENLRKALESTSKPIKRTAKKVNVMYLKNKANGPLSVPENDRVYFSVRKPTAYNAKLLKIDENIEETDTKQNIDPKLGIAVFVSESWSLGRCIDAISDTCQIKNENNIPGTPKLRLFRTLDKCCINPKKLDTKLLNLLEDQILADGDSISLEYVSDEDLRKINDSSKVYLV